MKNEATATELSSKPKIYRVPFSPIVEEKADNSVKYISAGVAVFAVICILIVLFSSSKSQPAKSELAENNEAKIIEQVTKNPPKTGKIITEKPKSDNQNLLDIVGKY
jgi:hypothetical protein